MPSFPENLPYRVARSRTGLGLFATRPITKGTTIAHYVGPLLDCWKSEDKSVTNKYLFEINTRWTIDGSVRENIARYINHACKPNSEALAMPRKRAVLIRAIRTIKEGEEISYHYGESYFDTYLKPAPCRCNSCEDKRRQARTLNRVTNIGGLNACIKSRRVLSLRPLRPWVSLEFRLPDVVPHASSVLDTL